jgi:hypothetical protein
VSGGEWLALVAFGGFALWWIFFPSSVIRLYGDLMLPKGAIRAFGVVLALWISFQMAVYFFK